MKARTQTSTLPRDRPELDLKEALGYAFHGRCAEKCRRHRQKPVRKERGDMSSEELTPEEDVSVETESDPLGTEQGDQESSSE